MEDLKCEKYNPSYDELLRHSENLNAQIYELKETIEALKWSLTKAYREMDILKSKSKMFEEDYYNEHERAEKLYEELNGVKK